MKKLRFPSKASKAKFLFILNRQNLEHNLFLFDVVVLVKLSLKPMSSLTNGTKTWVG